MPYIKITATRIDDGSLFYHQLKNYEKIHTWIAVDAEISDGALMFKSSGFGHFIELDKWNVKMEPIN